MWNKILPIVNNKEIVFSEKYIFINPKNNNILRIADNHSLQTNEFLAVQLTVFILKDLPEKMVLFRKNLGATLEGTLSFQAGKINDQDIIDLKPNKQLTFQEITNATTRELKEELGFSFEPQQLKPFCELDMQSKNKKTFYRFYINTLAINSKDISSFIFNNELTEAVIVNIFDNPRDIENNAEPGFYELFHKLQAHLSKNKPSIDITLTLKDQTITSFQYSPNQYIPIKGLLPKYDYGNINFGEIFSSTKSLTPINFYKKYITNNLIPTNKSYGTDFILTEKLAYEQIAKIFMLPGKNIHNILKTEIPYITWTTIVSNTQAFIWQDSFFKIEIEKAVESRLINKSQLFEKVYFSLQLYSDLIKMYGPSGEQEIFLRNMDIQIANLLQRLCINYVIGKGQDLSSETLNESSSRNIAIIKLIENSDIAIDQASEIQIKELLKLSIFSGIYWPQTETLKNQNNSIAVQEIGDKIFKAKATILKLNHIEKFIDKLNTAKNITMILDDNGESMFDLLLAQYILFKYPQIKINLLINKYPVSINISENTFNLALKQNIFKPLQNFIKNNRLKILWQYCPFNSFQTNHLTPESLKEIKNTDFIYVKGQNFFESFDSSLADTFYSFVTTSDLNIKLTGLNKGDGIFIFLKKGEARFFVKNDHSVTSLSNLLI